MKKFKLNSNKGITLIALVITIIVLLILAGVSIATLTGDNGILTKVQIAKEKTEVASEEEQRELAMIEANMNDEETEFQGVTIPAGFAPTKIKGESTIDDGLVIADSKGNSYVWIEVPETVYNEETKSAIKPSEDENPENFKFTEENLKKIEEDLQEYAKDYRNNEHYLDTYHDGYGLTPEKYTELKNKMLKSVYENGGFFIGQYEVGYEQGVNEVCRSYQDSTAERLIEHPTNEIPVIRANAYPYNWIRCSQAQNLASSMGSAKCNSSLMFGIQWDLVMKYIEKNSEKEQTDIKSDSTSWGNYYNAEFKVAKGKYSVDDGQTFTDVTEAEEQPYTKKANTSVLLTTGASEKNSVLNIYDIAGNVREWTLEYTGNENNPCSYRGGNYDAYSDKTAFARSGNSIMHNGYYIGFRTTLLY